MQNRGGLYRNGLASWRPAVLGMGRLLSIGVTSVAAAPFSADAKGPSALDEEEVTTPLWILGVASIALTLIGGVFAGLTIAYVGLLPPGDNDALAHD